MSRSAPTSRLVFTMRLLLLTATLLALASCAVSPRQERCPAGTQNLPDCPPLSAIDDPEINEIYEKRTWIPKKDIDQDLIELGKRGGFAWACAICIMDETQK